MHSEIFVNLAIFLVVNGTNYRENYISKEGIAR